MLNLKTRSGRIQNDVRKLLLGPRSDRILGSVEGAEGLADEFSFFAAEGGDQFALRLCAVGDGGAVETVAIVRFGPKGEVPGDDPHCVVWEPGDAVPVTWRRVMALAMEIIVDWGKERGRDVRFPED